MLISGTDAANIDERFKGTQADVDGFGIQQGIRPMLTPQGSRQQMSCAAKRGASQDGDMLAHQVLSDLCSQVLFEDARVAFKMNHERRECPSVYEKVGTSCRLNKH